MTRITNGILERLIEHKTKGKEAMKSTTSIYTGNTIYYAANGLFYSLSRAAVESFDLHNFKSVESMSNQAILFWTLNGHLIGGFEEYGKRCRKAQAERDAKPKTKHLRRTNTKGVRI